MPPVRRDKEKVKEIRKRLSYAKKKGYVGGKNKKFDISKSYTNFKGQDFEIQAQAESKINYIYLFILAAQTKTFGICPAEIPGQMGFSDANFQEDASAQNSENRDSECSSEISSPSNQSNKETQLINLGGRPKGDVWQYFDEINNGKGKHKGVICNFCDLTWSRGRANEMKSHLAIKCKGRVPKEIRLNYLREIDNEHESLETSTSISSKKTKNI
ncbi:hypothetical protein C1645_741920 [Glomus cerebriforme]|uniref:BED-type domain-containing protein n=1 Tax=Glomus cerebriforme TaxID=658196 RepID=A0A397SLK6_9GLOM|nr:hypothetical protein C1645_741920 [Glomus cerebriforme]